MSAVGLLRVRRAFVRSFVTIKGRRESIVDGLGFDSKVRQCAPTPVMAAYCVDCAPAAAAAAAYPDASPPAGGAPPAAASIAAPSAPSAWSIIAPSCALNTAMPSRVSPTPPGNLLARITSHSCPAANSASRLYPPR